MSTITDIYRSVITVLKDDDTIGTLCGDNILRSKVGEKGSIVLGDSTIFPCISIMANEEGTEYGLPEEDFTLTITAWESQGASAPHEKIEAIIFRINELFDRNPDRISDAGFSVLCHFLNKVLTTEIFYHGGYKAFFKDVVLEGKQKVSYLTCNS